MKIKDCPKKLALKNTSKIYYLPQNILLESSYKELENNYKLSTKELTQNLALCKQTIKTYETDIENYKFLLDRTNEDFK